MSINQKLKDNLIACTELNPQLVPALADGVTKGPFQSALDLSQIADAVKVSNLKPAEGSNTSHARPTMLSGVSGFVENVKAAIAALIPGAPAGAAAALTDTAKQDFAEWQGMIAAVALSNVYCGMGLNITVEQMDIKANGNAAMACVLREMEKDIQYRAAVDTVANTGALYYICQNGQPFAIFHPEICLCPMRQYDRNLFAGVLSWYDETAEDCHAAWKNILDLDAFCLSRIAWWAGKNNLLSYQNYINTQKPGLPVLNAALEFPNSIPTALCINAVPEWNGKGTTFGTAMMAYLDAAGNAHPLPNLFLDTMLITYAGSASQNKLVYNTATDSLRICFTGDNGALADYAPVPPFKRSIMEILDQVPLNSLNFRAKMDAQQRLESVNVELTIDGLKLTRVYNYDKLRLSQIPYLMLWPFVPMPKDMNLWNSYYATWRPQEQALNMLICSNGKLISPIDGNTMNYIWDGQGNTHKVFTPTSSGNQWPVCIGSNPFRYAVLTNEEQINGITEVEELGLVFMPRYPVFDAAMAKQVGATPVKLAIDFGTTSTVCALESSLLPGGTVTLPFKDYSLCVTCDDEKAKENANIYAWLGNTESGPAWNWNRKLFSVAQLFDQNPAVTNRSVLTNAANQEYYADGRLLMGEAMTRMDLSIGTDPLSAQQIMTDMKFNHSLDVRNYHAASIFLAGVYSYAVLYLLHEGVVPTAGCPFLELRVSYPNEVTLDALKQNWLYAQTILSRIMAPTVTAPISTITYYSEATAATAYNYMNPAFTNGMVSMDIGGGTTDISISNNTLHPKDVRNLSVRYAGREIMVTSLLEFYRKINPAMPAIIDDNSFAALWKPSCKYQVELFQKLRDLGEGQTSVKNLHDQNNNGTLRMIVEMLLNQGMTLGTASPTNATNLPRQLITMKFFMLLDLVAKAVRKNLDIWRDPDHRELTLVGNALEINLSVSGTGAQLLQYVFDCTMNELVDLQTPAAIRDPRMEQCLNLMNTVFYEELKDELPENVYTSLKIFVDPQVAEKIDVSYGMLTPQVEMLTPQVTAPVVAAVVPGKKAPVKQKTMSAVERQRQELAMQRTVSGYDLKSLDAYISDLKYYWEQYEEIYFPNPSITNRGLGIHVKAMSELMEASVYNAYFTSAKMEVAKSRAPYMIEPEQEPYLDQLKGMYMVEELLNWLIAQNQ